MNYLTCALIGKPAACDRCDYSERVVTLTRTWPHLRIERRVIACPYIAAHTGQRLGCAVFMRRSEPKVKQCELLGGHNDRIK